MSVNRPHAQEQLLSDLAVRLPGRDLRKILSGRLTLTGAVAHDEAQMAGARAVLARCEEVFGLTQRLREPTAA